MKIVILTAVFHSEHIGGTEVVSYNIARDLAKKGNEIHVVASGNRELPQESTEENFYVHRISYPKVPFFGILCFWFKIPFYIRKIKPEIIHCQSTQMGIPCVLCKIFLKTPFAVWGQGSDIYLNWKFKKIIHKLVFGNADKVIALTEDMKKKIQESYKGEILIVPNGVDPENFNILSKEEARERLNINSSEKIVLFVGSLQAVKGLKYLIEAFASGLPVVATRVGGIPEIIQEGENGYLVDAKNSEQIAAKISYLFSHGDAIKHISLQNIEKAKEYSWNLVGDKLLRIYSDCVKDT